MTRCRLFYRMIKRDCLTENNGSREWDTGKACALCRKESSSVSLICGHIDFMDRHFPNWLDDDLSFANAKLNETTTRPIRALYKYNAKLVAPVLEAVMALEEPRQRHIQEIIADLGRPYLPDPTGNYDVVVVDPPWPGPNGRVYDPNWGRGFPPYATMTPEEIATMTLPMAENAVLCLWTIGPFLHESFHILEAWQTKYKATLIWVKPNWGTGVLFRYQHEYVQIAFRGTPQWRRTKQFSSVLQAPRREHSRKPDEFYALIDTMFPGKKLDMFSREQRPGWDAWGAEVGKFG